MKVICSQENLLAGVQIVQRAVSLKNPLPILAGILLKAEGNSLTMMATDLEIGIICPVPVTVTEEGSTVVPARYFTEIVRRLPAGPVEIEKTDDNFTHIKYGQSEVKILGFAAEEFPSLPEVEKKDTLEIRQDLFRNIIRQVTFSASSDENRPIFTGCLLEMPKKEASFAMVATDTHRLALRKGSFQQANKGKDIKTIIPGKTLNEAARIFNSEENLTVGVTENHIVFEAQGISLVSRLIEGQFPNYHQVIPQQHKTKARVNNKEFLAAVERASLLSKDGPSVIKISLQGENMIINSSSPEIGQIHEELPVDIEGEETQIAFNAKYLVDVLKVMDADEIYLELSGALSPGVIKPVESENYIYLILPVRMV